MFNTGAQRKFPTWDNRVSSWILMGKNAPPWWLWERPRQWCQNSGSCWTLSQISHIYQQYVKTGNLSQMRGICWNAVITDLKVSKSGSGLASRGVMVRWDRMFLHTPPPPIGLSVTVPFPSPSSDERGCRRLSASSNGFPPQREDAVPGQSGTECARSHRGPAPRPSCQGDAFPLLLREENVL